jgi:outer membrane biosynthesis protein TonB
VTGFKLKWAFDFESAFNFTSFQLIAIPRKPNNEKMDKVGCNHLVIAGLLESDDYAKADFLSMHLEQHLEFTIDRQGRLECEWADYYNSVLVPLEITSDAIQGGETVVYTREGRVIGTFEDYRAWSLAKYSVEITYDDERMKAISATHVKRAQGVIDDRVAGAFEAKVDELLANRDSHLKETRVVLDDHANVVAVVGAAMKELEIVVTLLAPYLEALYALHHYPVKEETPEDAEPSSEATEGDESASGDDQERSKPADDDDSEPAPEPPAAKPKPEPEPAPEPESEPDAEAPKGEGEEEEKAEKAPKPKEEEEEPEPDQEQLDVQARLQEGFKLPPFDAFQKAVETLEPKGVVLKEFLEDIQKRIETMTTMINAEKFRWKKLEKEMLEFDEKLKVTGTMLSISILSVEELQIKAIQAEIRSYDDFLIPEANEKVLEAAVIKYAATFHFA